MPHILHSTLHSVLSCWLLSSSTSLSTYAEREGWVLLLHLQILGLGQFSRTSQFPIRNTNTNYSQNKRYECFSMPRVWLIFANIKVMTELCCQCLVEEHIKDNKPPGERQASENQAQWNVDQQLSKVMRAWHQLEPASLWHSVSQRLHCSWKTPQKTTNRKYISPYELLFTWLLCICVTLKLH